MNYKEIARVYFENFSNKNIAALSEQFDPECSLRDWEINAVGKEEVIEANKGIFDSVESIHVNPLNLYAEAQTVIGDLLITVNGAEKIFVVDIIEFTLEGKIKSIKAYKG